MDVLWAGGDPRRRASSWDYTELSRPQRQDIRAQQRTFEGAYMRTALGQLSFGLIVLKLFSSDLAPIGIVFTAYSVLVMVIALVRRARVSDLFLLKHHRLYYDDDYFSTSGSTVLALGLLTLCSYIALLVLLYR